MAALENGEFGAVFASGIAAIDCVIKMLKPGDEVVATNDLYGGSYRIFKTIFEQYGIVFHFVDMKNASAAHNAMNENTKLIWAETPTNPMINIIDIKALAPWQEIQTQCSVWTILSLLPICRTRSILGQIL